MQFYKSLNTDIFSSGRYKSVLLAFFITLFCYSLQITDTQAKTTSTIAAGVWGDAAKWDNGVPGTGDIVIINHVMDFTNVNINITGGGDYTFAPGSNGSSIPLALSMSNAIPAPVLTINANVSFAGGINLNGGTINVLEGATLTVTNQINQAGTKINVEAGANFNITGSYTNNGGDIHVDGLVAITGTYDGQNAAATVTGSGDITTTGHMVGINQSTIFGIVNPNCGGPCSGRNLCGRTVSSTPAAATYCTTGTPTPVVLTGSYSSGSSPAYQWQSSLSNTEAGFSNILGATSSTYSASPLVTTYYRVKITIGGCTSLTPVSLVTSSTCSKIWTGFTSAVWNVGTNWSPNGVPSISDDVTIPNVTNKPILSGARNVKSITINANSSLTLAANSTLNSYGNIVNNGTFISVATSTVIFKGTTALQTIYGVSELYKVTVNNTAGISILTPLTVKGTLSLTSGIITTNSNLTINFDNGGNIAFNTGDAGSISGDVTGFRNVIAHTHYISAPFSSVSSGQVDATTPLFYNNYWKMYSRNFTTQGWVAVTNTTTNMSLGTGYSLAVPVASTLSLTGPYSHTYALTGPAYSNATVGKYILIGNPYPSTINWGASSGWTKTNVANAIYFWNASNNTTSSYVANVGAGNPAGTPYIGAMQAFLVTTTGTGGSTSSVSIANDVRLSSVNAPYLRTAVDETVRIKIATENPDVWDDAVVRFNENATTGFDTDFDAYKIINQGFAPSVYTTSGTDNYAINSMEESSSLPIIPVSVKLPANGNYTLSVSKSDPSVDYVLIDKKLGTENLISGPAYVFSGLASDDADRFELQLRTAVTTGTYTANASAGLEINSAPKGFVIQTTQFNGSIANIEIMDITGKLVKVIPEKNLSANTTYIPVDLAEGAYIVKVAIENSVFAQMISIVK